MWQAVDKDTVLATGYSKAPAGTPMYEIFKHSGVVLEVDPKTNRIVDADVTMVTRLARRFLRQLLVGYDLSLGLEPLFAVLDERYYAPSKASFVMALRVAVQRYFNRHEPGADSNSK